MAAIWYILPPQILWIVLIGIAIIVLLLLLYRYLLKWQKKRKAAPMERGIVDSAATAPQGISEAAHMARVDDLRKIFEDGIEKFRAAGKNLYDFPWYMIAGEPGSGKTEAIRHCNIGFPPGLQDQFQGAGGTINMNWWFTDHAVILDTAGRLMFEEVETGGSSEWKEFLTLLKKSRPRCPVNGVFLVIPSDSLIKDTADEIEQKASKIHSLKVLLKSLREWPDTSNWSSVSAVSGLASRFSSAVSTSPLQCEKAQLWTKTSPNQSECRLILFQMDEYGNATGRIFSGTFL